MDEDVTFEFDPAFNVFADSVEVLLSDFEFTDSIVLSINETFTDKRLSPADSPDDTSIFEEVVEVSDLWKLKFAGLKALSDILVDSFTIQSDVAAGVTDPKIKNHFFITGFDADAAVVPIPGAIYLLGSGLIGLAGIRRRFRK